MSMCSLTDFIETSLGRCGGWVSTATVTGQGASCVDPSVRGGGLLVAKTGTFRGHQRGPQLAITGDFFMATDTRCLGGKVAQIILFGETFYESCRAICSDQQERYD